MPPLGECGIPVALVDDDPDGHALGAAARRLHDERAEAAMQTSITSALFVGLAGLVGSGALATGLGWLAEAACTWCGVPL